MSIVVCHGCRSRLRLPETFREGKVRCPHCGAIQAVRDPGDTMPVAVAGEPPLRPLAEPPPGSTFRDDAESTPLETGSAEPAFSSPTAGQEVGLAGPAVGGGTPRIVKRPLPLQNQVEMPVEAEAVEEAWWYLTTPERSTYGPVELSELSRWVADGRVGPDCVVYRDGDQAWRWARDVFPVLHRGFDSPPHGHPDSAASTCPACRTVVDPSTGRCYRCGTSPSHPGSHLSAAALRRETEGIAVCLLISAIANIVFAMIWLVTCYGIVIAVPLVILCVFEFSLHCDAPRLRPSELASRSQGIAIFELIVGMFSPVALVCGIVQLVNCHSISKAQAG